MNPRTSLAAHPAPASHDARISIAKRLAIGMLVAFVSMSGQAEVRFGLTRYYTEGQFAVQGIYNTEAQQQFGGAIAVGDFDGDGVQDTAVSSPNENTSCCFGFGGLGEGVVRVAYAFAEAAPTGVMSESTQMITLYSVSGISSQPDSHFGQSLLAMDADNDGYDDLIIGAPNLDVSYAGSTRFSAGGIYIVWGSESGLVTESAKTYNRSSFAAGEPMTGDGFGYALSGHGYSSCSATPGDPTGDSVIVVGIPYADVNGELDAGMVVAGRQDGRDDVAFTWTISQDDYPSSVGQAEPGDQFGFALSPWGFDTIWVGAPGEAIDGSGANAGAILSLKAECQQTGFAVEPKFNTAALPDPDGVSYRGHQSNWNCSLGTCNYDDFSGTPTAGDRFGEAIAFGRGSNLVVGAPGANGSGTVFFEGLIGSGASFAHPVATAYNGGLANGARLGASLVRIDLDGDGTQDIVAGAPGVGEIHGRLLNPWSVFTANPAGQTPEFLKTASDGAAGMGAALGALPSAVNGPDMLLVGEPGWDQIIPTAASNAGRLNAFVTRLNLDSEVVGNGRIISDEGDIDCAGTCRTILPQDQTRHLSAVPDQYHAFGGWSGDCSGGALDCTVLLEDQDEAVQATFTARIDPISVLPSGPLGGNVIATIGGVQRINCARDSGVNSGTCDAFGTAGLPVQLVAEPDSGARAVWTNAPCNAYDLGADCNYGPLDGDDEITVEFILESLRRIALTITPEGGQVSSLDGQIFECRDPASDACVAYFPTGTTVSLTATLDPGFLFLGWSGDLGTFCGDNNPCVFTLDSDMSRGGAIFRSEESISVFKNSFESGAVEAP